MASFDDPARWLAMTYQLIATAPSSASFDEASIWLAMTYQLFATEFYNHFSLINPYFQIVYIKTVIPYIIQYKFETRVSSLVCKRCFFNTEGPVRVVKSVPKQKINI